MIGDLRFGFSGVSGQTRRAASSAALVAGAVFLACLFGILTRPVGFLATFWPANAVMLGLLMRMPGAAGPMAWGAGAAGFMAADLLTGSPLAKALILNGANMISIAVTYAVYTRSPAGRTGLRAPASMLYLLLAAAAGGAAAGMMGGIANPMLFGGGVLDGWTFWFATELVNYVTILPVILSAPALSGLRRRLASAPAPRNVDIPPAAALIVSFAVAAVIGGPGAIAFPVPALLWCGLAYPIFPTAVLTLLFGMWSLIIISTGYGVTQIYGEMAVISLRLGISLIAIAPIMLACVMQSRNELVARLHHLAMHDPLTGISNRKAFRDEAGRQLGKAKHPVALLMFDLDHFKAVNDTYGHAAGDRVLITFSERVRACLRAGDGFGRLGGEEFAALIVGCGRADIAAIAERVRQATCQPIVLDDGRLLRVTASIGVALSDPNGAPFHLDAMLQVADAMLYQAKDAGRDRVEIAVAPPSHSSAPDSCA